MTGDGPRASHPNPDAPRAIQRRNGHLWHPCQAARRGYLHGYLRTGTEQGGVTPRFHGKRPLTCDIAGQRP
ncbi:DUF6087 family protein [Streptomyces cinereoruber]|uniref:DUF6087 family protein n=1 Tax=Streptomyces cinereoruber TaxID=67260 RepID=UPI003645F32C